MKKEQTSITEAKTTTGKKRGRPRKTVAAKEAVTGTATPLMANEATAAQTSTRRNSAGLIDRTDKYKNIEDGLVPFRNAATGVTGGANAISVKESVELCQKAYYNFAIFRNIIDLMTEFATGDIYFKDGSQKSRDFFKAYCKKVNMWDVQDQFFREYFRSGNCFLYRFSAKLLEEDVKKITSVFGSDKTSLAAKGNKVEIPVKFVLLNPADIRMSGTVNFLNGEYFKTLNSYEVARLKNPQTEEDKEFFNSLPAKVRSAIQGQTGQNKMITFPLDSENCVSVFYKKQDYEPFAVPMGYPVLEDINAKHEMKKIDMAVARTMQQAILLVTTGTEPDKGGVSQKNLNALQTLFENQSVGRVLVADWTTEAKFVIPEIATLLDPKKYEILDRDINIGLNNVFAGGEKFANQKQKVDVFIARLKHARESFVNNFLFPEIKRISKELGFKNYPTPCFEDINVDDSSVRAKIYGRMAEVGLLTSEELIKAMETGELPDSDSSIESQKKFKSHKDMGLYKPLIGGGKGDGAGQPGRPDGTEGIPQSTDSVGPIGTGVGEATGYYGGPIGSDVSFSEKKPSFSAMAVKKAFSEATELEKLITKAYRKENKVRKIQAADELLIDQITKTIIANEEMENWKNKIDDYLKDPTDKNPERLDRVYEIGATHGLDLYLSSILLASETK